MKEYTSLALEEGIRVLIDDQDASLYPEKHGFSIRPGVIANIALKKVPLLSSFILLESLGVDSHTILKGIDMGISHSRYK